MISIKQINEKDIDLCYELDLKTISFWSKKQWTNEFKKEGVKVFGLLYSNLIVGICASQLVIDEVYINYFVIDEEYRNRGLGSNLMGYLIKLFEKHNMNKILLEVSHNNHTAKKFYGRFNFYTVGIRRNYYKDGSDALLKEKKINNKIVKKFNCSDNQKP